MPTLANNYYVKNILKANSTDYNILSDVITRKYNAGIILIMRWYYSRKQLILQVDRTLFLRNNSLQSMFGQILLKSKTNGLGFKAL